MTLNSCIIDNKYFSRTRSFKCTTSQRTDIDECALGTSGCNQICTNTIGSYVCSCYLGYQISSNNSTTCAGKKYITLKVCIHFWDRFHEKGLNACFSKISIFLLLSRSLKCPLNLTLTIHFNARATFLMHVLEH